MSLAVQGDDIFLHNLARCAIATALSTPTAGVGWSIAFSASWFAQKKDARPVGGRGISAFPVRFLLRRIFLIDPDVAGTRAEIDLPSQSIPFWGGQKKNALVGRFFTQAQLVVNLPK
ncbi:hypothetical protein AL049_21465 [Pseudomonas syringae pv. cerasicola]|uniref:Uncharacterized protein n=2 Tax=Pseudomonas syringae group TaxID=136849 RepID=A0A0P9N5T3_PSESX|nr:hypothetical protein ALO50_103571 [Pseudomonas syringae pv. cerasicola]KWS91578.1 hypothetical protein AL049_21465 [Pseudomonas syringae pv. cerasicola]PHN79449.1 hypothetical protein AO252_13650 [Pseudomonas syringae pv. cerasicola]RMS89010.1 hypothetical protein ALP60_103150 [Pseudomonas savastanoi]